MAKKLNWRIILFAAIVLLPLGWMGWTVIHLEVTGGIEREGNYLRIDLKSLGNYPFDDVNGEVKDVPQRYRDLDGKKVLLTGQQYVDYTAAPMVNRFQLVYSIANCCFNGPPKVQERVFAQVPKGKMVPYYSGLVDVYGTLHVRVVRENEKVTSLFDMDVEKIQQN